MGASGSRRVHFLRAERSDRSCGDHNPRGKVGERFGERCYSPWWRTVEGPRNDRAAFAATRSRWGVRMVGTGQPCPATAPLRRPS